MVPLRDINPSRRFPFLTLLLIGVNAVLFLPYGNDAEALHEAIYSLGFIPSAPFSWERVVSSMFMHASWAHLLFNMWTLWVFGDNVEDFLGRYEYVTLYLLSGLGAVLMHMALYPTSTTPVVGASGAISGVMGAYLVLFPQAKIWTWIPPLFFLKFSARFFLVVWFILQLVEGISSRLSAWVYGEASGIAFWAHIGGFAVGWGLSRFLKGRNEAYRLV